MLYSSTDPFGMHALIIGSLQTSQSFYVPFACRAVLDRKQLCIEPCKYAFRLVIRLVCVVDDGNLFDAAVLSTLAALRNCKLPETQIVDNCVFRTNKESSPITLSRNPLSVTCALYGDSILADPDAREEKHQTGSVTCVLDEADSVLLVKQNADTGVSKAVIERAISLCTSKSVKLRRLLN
jgi:exosome complex RNA-binding protein Rrp42 (RNase PH superfamily)